MFLYFLEFEGNDELSEGAIDALKAFVRVGEAIRKDTGFEGSFSKTLELILANSDQNIAELLLPELLGQSIVSKGSFFAFAAPSMDGKTQFAFVFREVKPLYFPMSETQKSSDKPSQPIYLNFTNHAVTLLKCAKADLELVGPNNAPSASTLKSQHQHKKLYVLGFLKKLAEADDFNANNQTWMQYHANRPKFSFKPLSIEDVTESFKGSCLFLDEFVADPVNTLIRNIARAVGLPCIVANTNTKVANLVDPAGASGSGSSGRPVWSFVVTRLDPAARNALNTEFEYSKTMAKLKELFPAGNPIYEFLVDFDEVQMKRLRPGVAAFVAQILRDYAKEPPHGLQCTLGKFLDHVCSGLAEKIIHRKSQIRTSLNGSIGQIALLLPESYAGFKVAEWTSERKVKSWRQARFLEEHLFYLKNPVDSTNQFATFKPSANDDQLLHVWIYGNLRPWVHEYTFFNSEEFFTITGCLFIPFCGSISYLFHRAEEKTTQLGTSFTQSINPNDVYLDGNALEVQAAVSIARASHFTHCQLKRAFSFKGPLGTEFFKNLIYELISVMRNAVFDNLSFGFPPSLLSFLRALRIPFLYGINHDNALFRKFSSFQNDFFVKTYERTSVATQIDGKFEACFETAPGNFATVDVCCECKNRSADVDASLLNSILDGFEMNEAKLGIVFCRSAVNSLMNDSKFADRCGEKYHVYRLKRSGFKFSFEKCFAKRSYHGKPVMVIIILETLIINPA